VVRSLLNRADNIISSPSDRSEEVSHINKVLRTNNYDSFMLNIPKTKSHTPPPAIAPGNVPAAGKRRPLPIPYSKGLSEKLQRIFRNYGISIYHKPGNTLRQALVRPKDKVCMWKCGDVYVGETSRTLKKRFSEHLSQKGSLTAVGDHIAKFRHQIGTDDVKVLDSEPGKLRRKVKEAIYIKEQAPQLNRDRGYELAPIYDHLVSHDMTSQSSHVTLP
jgi:hypothetical protein